MLDSNKVKNKLTEQDIIKLCCHLQGNENYLFDNQNHPIFSTFLCHKGDSQKLYYFPETKLFHCFTCGSTYDVFELVRRAKDFETFKESFDYIVKFFGFRNNGFEEEQEVELINDWDIFQKVQDYNENPSSLLPQEIKPIQENLMEYFYPLAAPEEWQKEGISAEVMRYFNIRIDSALHKIIIEHRDVNGNLVGIRGRSYDPFEVNAGKKYMPVFIQGEMYNHPLGKNLYGLYNNKETIKKIKKICIFEAEKSVLQMATMYGIENNWSVAVCGSNISHDQIALILSMDVNEVVLAFDADHLGAKGDQDTIEYEQKLLKIVTPLLPYVNISIIFDYDHLLPHKASPSDCGKEIFEKLYHSRVRLYTKTDKDIIKDMRRNKRS